MDELLTHGLSAAPPEYKAVIRLLDPACDAATCAELLGSSPDLFRRARQENVAGLIAHRWMPQLRQTQSPEQLGRWRGLTYAAAVTQARDEVEISAILSALTSAGVVPVVMRGLWLAYALYPDPSLRPHTDIDLLLPLDGLEDGLRALMGLGYDLKGASLPIDTESVRRRIRAGYRSGFVASLRPATEARRLSIDPHVDLHLVGRGWWPYGPSPEELFERTIPWSLLGERVLALQLPMALLGLVENVARHAVTRAGRGNWLVRMCDMLLVSQQMGPDQWEQFAEDAHRFRLGIQSAIFLDLVERMWGRHWPEGVLEGLKTPATAYRLARLATSRPRWLGQPGRVALLQSAATLTWPAAVVYVARNVLFAIRGWRADGSARHHDRGVAS